MAGPSSPSSASPLAVSVLSLGIVDGAGAPHGLRGVHRPVGMMEQGAVRAPVLGEHRDADAGVDGRGHAVDLERPLQPRSSRSATSMAASGPPTSGSTTANSSPPTRPIVSMSRSSSASRGPTWRSSTSPARCPSTSLTSLPVEVDEQHRQPGAVAGRAQGVFQVQSEPEAVGQRADRVEVGWTSGVQKSDKSDEYVYTGKHSRSRAVNKPPYRGSMAQKPQSAQR